MAVPRAVSMEYLTAVLAIHFFAALAHHCRAAMHDRYLDIPEVAIKLVQAVCQPSLSERTP